MNKEDNNNKSKQGCSGFWEIYKSFLVLIHKFQNKTKIEKKVRDSKKKSNNSETTRPQQKKYVGRSMIKIMTGFFRFLVKSFSLLRHTTIDLVVLLLILVIGYGIIRTDPILVEPFEVPESFKRQGYTGRTVANKLIDQVNLIAYKASTAMKRKEFAAAWFQEKLQIEVSGSGISFTSFKQHIRGLFRWKTTKVCGEVVLLDEKGKNQKITIRVIGKPAKIITGSRCNLERTMLKAAEHIHKYTQPFILASYYHSIDDTPEKKRCLETIRHILRTDPEDDDHWAQNLWGVVLYEQQDYEGAIAKYSKAIAMDSKCAFAYSNWGLCLYRQEKYEDALAMHKRAIELDAKYASAHSNLGMVLDKMGRYQEAIAAFEEAVAINSEFANAYLNWGLCFHNQKKYDKAIDKYQKVVEIDPEHADAYYNMGFTFYEMKECKRAIAIYEKAVELNPKHIDAYCNMGIALCTLKYHEKAIKIFRIALDINPRCVVAHNNLGKIYFVLRNYDKAILEFTQVLKIDPKCPFVDKAKNYIKEIEQIWKSKGGHP